MSKKFMRDLFTFAPSCLTHIGGKADDLPGYVQILREGMESGEVITIIDSLEGGKGQR